MPTSLAVTRLTISESTTATGKPMSMASKMTFLEMVEVIYHSTLNKYRYSEQINFVNLWLDKQAIGFIFPIHYKKEVFRNGIPLFSY